MTRPGNPDGGLGTLTDDEVAEAYQMIDDDLLNGPHKICRCGGSLPCCGGMTTDPTKRLPTGGD